jgi:hypothetical protein
MTDCAACGARVDDSAKCCFECGRRLHCSARRPHPACSTPRRGYAVREHHIRWDGKCVPKWLLRSRASHQADRAGQHKAKTFQQRDLSGTDYVYLWVDGLHLEVRLE